MTWNISKNGSKAEVKQHIVEKVVGFHNHAGIAAALVMIVEDLKPADGEEIVISGSGYDRGGSLNFAVQAIAPAESR
jgi:hypothetical protein